MNKFKQDWINKEEPYICRQIKSGIKEIKGMKELKGCNICKGKLIPVGYTFLMGMVTGIIMGCQNHKNVRTIIALPGKEKYFTGIMFR